MENLMKKFVWISYILFAVIQCTGQEHVLIVVLSKDEMNALSDNDERFSYFGPEICSLIKDFSDLKEEITHDLPFFNALCAIINEDKKTAPHDLIEAALREIIEHVTTHPIATPHKNTQHL